VIWSGSSGEEEDDVDIMGSSSESEHRNNARPPIEPASAGKGSSEATAVGLAVASRALWTALVSVGLWLLLPLVSCLATAASSLCCNHGSDVVCPLVHPPPVSSSGSFLPLRAQW
jgi:hypothetical protein